MTAEMERRNDPRQDIQLQVEFAPVTAFGTPVARNGITQNVGSGGVYFHTNMASALSEASKVSVRIAIPGSTEDPAAPLALTAHARVLRIDEIVQDTDESPDDPLWGVAVRFDHRPNIKIGYDFWLVDNE